MTKPLRKAVDGSLRSRLMAFFDANPDEELTIEDIAVKFDVQPAAISETIRRLIRHTLVERVTVYRRHP